MTTRLLLFRSLWTNGFDLDAALADCRAGKFDGVEGPVHVPLVPFGLSGSVAGTDLPPPTLGAHTDEILEEIGYTVADIAELRGRKVV